MAAIPIAAVPPPVITVPPVAAPIAVTMMPVLVAVVAVLAPAERPLRLMDGSTHRRSDFLSRCPGLGFGVVRCRGDGLAHVPRSGVARPLVPVPVAMVPIAVAAVTAPVRMARSAAVMATPIAAVPALPIPVAAVAAALAGIGSPLAAAPRVPPTATPAFREGNVVMARRERHR